MGSAMDHVDTQLRQWADQRGFSGVALVTRGGVTELEGLLWAG